MLRRAAEIVLGPLILRRRLPAVSGEGVIFVSGRVGGLRYLFKPSSRWDPPLLEAARLLVEPGAVVWDIGSNVGLFAMAAAFHAGPNGQVIAVEADNDAVALLSRTCRRHSQAYAPVSVVPVAVGGTPGFVRFAVAKRARAANSIEGFGSTQTGGTKETRRLPCTTLDAMLDAFPPPNVLKVDVEGAELAVLTGGARLLREVRPVMHCEVASENSAEVSRLLRRMDYTLWDAAALASRNVVEVDDAVWNTIAVPAERKAQFLARVAVRAGQF